MPNNEFVDRHIGPSDEEIELMLKETGDSSLDKLIEQTIPASIRIKKPLNLPEGISEYEYSREIRKIASKNIIFKSYIGLGYYDTITPAVIQRNILENPSWYTSYTPYQAEISQGRLEALLIFQTMVMELTGMELANASLLDEGTAAAESMIMLFHARCREQEKKGANLFFVDENIFPQTLDVLKTRSAPLGIELVSGNYDEISFDDRFFGAFVQYPTADGKIIDYKDFVTNAHSKNVAVSVAADLLSLTILTPPGEWGADVVVGSTQRFGIPMGFGGPHAAYFATLEKFRRHMPGRIIGASVDAQGNKALRLSLQTREQHIRREKATSNICTAQALLASMAAMYAVYHGAEGLRKIASNIHHYAGLLNEGLKSLGYNQENTDFFDTLKINLPSNLNASDIRRIAEDRKQNYYYIDYKTVEISLDETDTLKDVNAILKVFSLAKNKKVLKYSKLPEKEYFDACFSRKSQYLVQPVFKQYHGELEMMRYLKRLEHKDFSLTEGMIPLGSCTMKLTGAMEIFALTWPEFGKIHPFAPDDQTKGFQQLIWELEQDLKSITGFDAFTFQPNSGAAGEYTGMMIIRKYHQTRGDLQRNVILIPSSAHGTNPASAAMAGMKVVVVDCDDKGNIDVEKLRQLATENKNELAGFMITYPSTHGVFEASIKEMVDIIHQNGGLVYMDGANMNAQVGLTSPASIGADLCHLNLHKTFAIPHGGGGPGVGPVGVRKELVPFLPSHPLRKLSYEDECTAVSSAPYGSASVLTISHAYIKMMGGNGLAKASKVAILNANYLSARLKNYFPTLYTGGNGKVGHELILECRDLKEKSGVTETDIAKRLMDYGFHAPTLSFPVHGTLMVEPTESESLHELNRFVEAMVSIYHEIEAIAQGKADNMDNVLKNAPHTATEIAKDQWEHPYSRMQAAFPVESLKESKFWPSVSRIDDAYGDRNLVCSC